MTVTSQAKQLDALLLATTGFSNKGIELLAPNQANLIKAINTLQPTTDLLYKYNPEYTCMLIAPNTCWNTVATKPPAATASRSSSTPASAWATTRTSSRRTCR